MNNIYILFLFFLFAAFVSGFYYGRKRKKWQENNGEGLVRKLLVRHCKESTSHVLNNITLEYNGGSTQIDHILLTQNGILVIETKHFSGWIFGHEKQKQWTQIIYKVKHRFLNPIFQNKKHVSAVQQLLDFLPKDQVAGVVVFTGDAEFKTEMPDGVIYVKKLTSYIEALELGGLSENRVQFCAGRLECKRFEITEKTDVEHQAYLEKKYGKTS